MNLKQHKIIREDVKNFPLQIPVTEIRQLNFLPLVSKKAVGGLEMRTSSNCQTFCRPTVNTKLVCLLHIGYYTFLKNDEKTTTFSPWLKAWTQGSILLQSKLETLMNVLRCE